MDEQQEQTIEQAFPAIITIAFPAHGTMPMRFQVEGCDYMQMFAAAKLLEIQAEGAFMQEQIEQSKQQGQKLVIPKVRLPGGRVS